ncbi:MAG: PIN domain-containing protein [Thermoplasmata archaeon]
MKAVDFSFLKGLLEGDPRVLRCLSTLRGERLVTTEIEYAALLKQAEAGAKSQRKARREAVRRLRERVTVVPIDDRASRVLEGALTDDGMSGSSLSTLHSLCALEALGCDVVYSIARLRVARGWRLKPVNLRRYNTRAAERDTHDAEASCV